MTEVKVLLTGYTSGETGEGRSCSTITLVKDHGITMIVDPGTSESQQVIIDKLKAEGVGLKDVNVVFITHSHMDHYRNIGMFPDAKALDYWGWWTNDVWEDCDGNVTDDIKIIKTPGHNYDGVTLLVKTKQGTIAICGDVFWKEGEPKDDPYATDKKKLEESRKMVLEMADYIIPGHGKMFKVEKR